MAEKDFDQVANAYIWLDYFCVPQLVDGQQLPHILSIPSYVERCNMFVALTPHSIHCDTGTQCNFYSWLQRGWCRTELWCHFLSVRSDMPIIVVKTSTVAELFTAPVWHRYPVHSGEFSVEQDRESCMSVIEDAMRFHLSELKSNKATLTSYRLYLSMFEEVTGRSPKRRNVEDFLKDFLFSKPWSKGRGSLSPVACATLCGDSELVRSLVGQKASMKTQAPLLPEVSSTAGCGPLHLAVWFKNDLEILETLLELRADPNDTNSKIGTPLAFCRSAKAVRLLVQYKADVNCPARFVSRYPPLQGVASLYAPCEVLQALLELRANVLGGSGGFASMSPLHALSHNTVSAEPGNELKSAQLLMEHRADVNQVLQPEGLMKSVELMTRAYCRLASQPSGIMRLMRDASATPLGWAVICDNERMTTFLLHARADPEIRNNRGLRPIDFAPSKVREILQNPSNYIYLLECGSEQVSETF
eukprot:Skav223244  [mRNA]  locus=scaffold2231:432416:433837:+ [translate_table: standard]